MNKNSILQRSCCLICSMIILTLSSVQSFAKPQKEDIRLNLELKNVTLDSALDSIKAQSPFTFIVGQVDLARKVSISMKNGTIGNVCAKLFTPLDIDYKINGHYIYLSNRPKVEPRTVGGTVIDHNGQPIPGASVFVQGTTTGTTTDIDGRFTLLVPGNLLGGSLEFNSLGYEIVRMVIGSNKNFTVTLNEEAVSLEGTVVTALGIRRDQKALSYNVQEVNAELLTSVKDANFINSLAGKVAGVAINTSSSGVGGASKVVLRGNKSISQSSNALYVIDGIPMYNFGGGGGTEFDSKGASESIADLNPEDIQSISVLTGAAAAALYGSQAANGAVMITTKKGESGKLKVSFSSNTEFLNPFVLRKFQNRYGTGLNGRDSGSGVYSWGAYIPEGARYNYSPKDYFETGHTYTNAFSISGGTDKNQTYFSAAAVNSDGIIPNNIYDRYNFTFRNTSYFLKDKLKLDASASYIMQKDQNMTNQGVYANPLTSAYLFPRGENFDLYRNFERYNSGTKLMEQFWGDDLAGDLRMQNPYWINYRNLRNNNKRRYMLSLNVNYDILDWLNIAGRVRIDNANNLYTQKYYATTEATISEGGKNGHYTEARTYDT